MFWEYSYSSNVCEFKFEEGSQVNFISVYSTGMKLYLTTYFYQVLKALVFAFWQFTVSSKTSEDLALWTEEDLAVTVDAITSGYSQSAAAKQFRKIWYHKHCVGLESDNEDDLIWAFKNIFCSLASLVLSQNLAYHFYYFLLGAVKIVIV